MRAIVVMGFCLVAGGQAIGGNVASQAPSARRQLSDCMSRQMTISRTISYNEASRVCKDLLRAQSDKLASNQPKPAGAR